MSASGDGVDGKVIAETSVSGGDTCTSDTPGHASVAIRDLFGV